MISYESEKPLFSMGGLAERVVRLVLIGIAATWNPWPKKLKVMKNRKYVLDIRARRIDRLFQQREINRRKEAGEEERQWHKIGLKGQADFSGKTG